MSEFPKNQTMEILIGDLCDLLRQVLGQGEESHSSVRIDKLLSELTRISISMERHATALEQTLPSVAAIQEVTAKQKTSERLMIQMSQKLDWICQTLEHPAFPEES
jgi:hypothetical protein